MGGLKGVGFGGTVAVGNSDQWPVTGGSLGVSVTPGASDAYLGTWTQVLTALSGPADGLVIWVSEAAVGAADKSQAIKIGVDLAGGSTYVQLSGLADILCGGSGAIWGSSTASAGYRFWLPVQIPSGATVAVDVRGVNATAGTVRVFARAVQTVGRPYQLPTAQVVEKLTTLQAGTIGPIAFTSGVGAWGSYSASLGTSTIAAFYALLSIGSNDTTFTERHHWVDLAYSTDAGTTFHTIIDRMMWLEASTSESCGQCYMSPLQGYAKIPAGATFYVRGATRTSAINSNPTVMLHLFGE